MRVGGSGGSTSERTDSETSDGGEVSDISFIDCNLGDMHLQAGGVDGLTVTGTTLGSVDLNRCKNVDILRNQFRDDVSAQPATQPSDKKSRMGWSRNYRLPWTRED